MNYNKMNVLSIGEYTPNGQLIRNFKINPTEIGKQSLLLIKIQNPAARGFTV